MKKICTILFTAALLYSCAEDKNENAKLIIGDWVGAQWLVNGDSMVRNAKATGFTFNDKGEYGFIYPGNDKTGTYKVDHDQLFTTAKGEVEIMVKIRKLNKDSLVFDMNNGGIPETITLLRKP